MRRVLKNLQPKFGNCNRKWIFERGSKTKMDNKKISTILGTVLIIIFSATALAFVLVHENKQSKSEINNNVAVISENLHPEENKKIETENKNKQDDKNEFIYYRSANLGVEFSYKAYRTGEIGSFIQEKGNEIRLMVAEENNERNLERCSKDNECQLINGFPYWPGIGGLNVYEKNTNESIEDAIAKLINKNGGDASRCNIETIYPIPEEKSYQIKPKNKYVPIKKEDHETMQDRQNREQYNIKVCSKFARSSYFIYHPDESKTKFSYIYWDGQYLDAPDINYDSIKFLNNN